MKTLFLAMALVLVLAIPASALVKQPTPMDIEVFEFQYLGGYTCNDDRFEGGQCYHCDWWLLGDCMLWTKVGMTWDDSFWYYPQNIHTAEVGDRFYVKATLLSEVTKNTKYQYMVKLGTEVLYKSAKTTFSVGSAEYTFYLEGFNEFTKPGMHSFIFQVFKPDGTILQTVKKVYVYAPPSAAEDQPEAGELIIEEAPTEEVSVELEVQEGVE